jgi:hypothetical protein
VITASELAGFCAAHAVSSVADGGILTPILAYASMDGERGMQRLVPGNSFSEAVALGRDQLEANPMGADDAALLYDGRISINEEKIRDNH